MVMHAISLKGAQLVDSILAGKKNVENRSFRIKRGWYALHTSQGKIESHSFERLARNAKDAREPWTVPEAKDLPKSCITGLAHFSGEYRLWDSAVQGKCDQNPWVTGKVANVIDKVIHLGNATVMNVKGNRNIWLMSGECAKMVQAAARSASVKHVPPAFEPLAD